MNDHSLATDADAMLRFIHEEARGEADARVDVEPFLEAAQWSDEHFEDVRAYVEEAEFVYPVEAPPGEPSGGSTFAMTREGLDYVAQLTG